MSSMDRRHQQRNQEADDADNDEQFNDREAAFHATAHLAMTRANFKPRLA